MKILVVSDSHGRLDNLKEIISRNDFDALIHLGDHSKDLDKIQGPKPKKLIAVRGNCDTDDINSPEEVVVELGGQKFFICHGHRYNVKSNLNRLYYRARELGADIALFGHTHTYFHLEEDIILFNPGSLEFPNFGQKPSYGILEIKDGKINISKNKINF